MGREAALVGWVGWGRVSLPPSLQLLPTPDGLRESRIATPSVVGLCVWQCDILKCSRLLLRVQDYDVGLVRTLI